MDHDRSLFALLCACVGVTGCVPLENEPEAVGTEEQALVTTERVVRSARGGRVDLDLQFSEFFGGPFTLSTWFQPEFVRGYEGPILAENGTGRFFIAMDMYQNGTSMLMLKVGQKVVRYPVPNLARRAWYHLAVTRSNFTYPSGSNTFSVYLDGQKLTPKHFDHIGEWPVTVTDPEISFSSSDPMTSPPSGNVRIGRRTDSDSTRYWQFYGLVDEVAVYSGVSPTGGPSIATLAAERRVVETSSLIKGWTFDSVVSTNPKLRNAATFAAPTTKVSYDNALVSIFDMPDYASPTEATYLLPFAPNQAWKAIQEYDDTTSHFGGSAFCWDFVRVGATTQDTNVYASAEGDVIAINDSYDDELYVIPDDWKNQPWNMQIRTAPDEATSHRHLREESVEQALCPFGNCSPLPSETANTLYVYATQKVGVVGTSRDPSNSHLHFGLRSLQGSETHTIPMAFSNYQTCDLDPGETVTTTADLSKCSWRNVTRGMPRQGEIIRRP